MNWAICKRFWLSLEEVNLKSFKSSNSENKRSYLSMIMRDYKWTEFVKLI